MHALTRTGRCGSSWIIDHVALNDPTRPVSGRSAEGPRVATSYAAIRDRALRVAQRLARDGIGRGDVVGVTAWNTRGDGDSGTACPAAARCCTR